MNSIIQKWIGLVVTIVPAGTQIQTLSGPATINDTSIAADNSTIWMTQSTYEKVLFEQSMGNIKFDRPLILPTQSEIETWPQLKRKAVTGQDIAKYLEKAKKALEYVP